MRRLTAQPAVNTAALKEAVLATEAATIEANLIDLNSQAGAILALEDNIETTTGVMVALENIAICLEGTKPEEFTPGFAGLLGTTVGALYAQVGARQPTGIAVESDSPAELRAAQLNVAMESIKETVGRIWKAIIAALEKLIAWVKSFFSKAKVTTESLKARAEKLIVKIRDLPTDFKTSKITDPKLLAALSAGGKAEPKAIERSLWEVVKLLEDSHVENSAEATANLLEKMGSPKEFIESFNLKNLMWLPSFPGKRDVTGDKKFPQGPEGFMTIASEALPGDYFFYIIAPKDVDVKGEAAVNALPHLKYMMAAWPGEKVEPPKELPPVSDYKEIAKTCLDIIGRLAKAEESSKKLEVAFEKALTKAKALAQAAEKMEADDPDAKYYRLQQTVTQYSSKLLIGLRAQMVTYGLHLVKVMLDALDATTTPAKEEPKKEEPVAKAA